MDTQDVQARSDAVLDELSGAIVCDREVLELILTGYLAGGNVLLEDVPGTGKTLTARSLARALGLSFSRIQFTPDLLPSDVTGSSVFDESTGDFEFQEGPLFANIVLADEINRASPKTQSALLEAMEEGQVTVDGETRPLPDPFFVIATQNPVEQEGTFPLPEAQLDRFIVKTSIGYPDEAGELELVNRRADRYASTPTVGTVCDSGEANAMRDVPEDVRVEEDLRKYVVRLSRATRDDGRVQTGVSPRGTQRLFESARAYAAIHGREFVTPDDVKTVARVVLPHRLVLTADARVEGAEKEDVVVDVLDDEPVPSVSYRARA